MVVVKELPGFSWLTEQYAVLALLLREQEEGTAVVVAFRILKPSRLLRVALTSLTDSPGYVFFPSRKTMT